MVIVLMMRRAAVLAIGGTAAALLVAGFDARAQSDAKVKIAFAGDSLVDNYWGGFQHLTATDACLKRKLELGRFGSAGRASRLDPLSAELTLLRLHGDVRGAVRALLHGRLRLLGRTMRFVRPAGSRRDGNTAASGG